jgi:hypothetical protein
MFPSEPITWFSVLTCARQADKCHPHADQGVLPRLQCRRQFYLAHRLHGRSSERRLFPTIAGAVDSTFLCCMCRSVAFCCSDVDVLAGLSVAAHSRRLGSLCWLGRRVRVHRGTQPAFVRSDKRTHLRALPLWTLQRLAVRAAALFDRFIDLSVVRKRMCSSWLTLSTIHPSSPRYDTACSAS